MAGIAKLSTSFDVVFLVHLVENLILKKMKVYPGASLTIMLALLVLSVSCQNTAPKTNNGKQGDGTPAKVYQQYCATCHGVGLNGGNAQSLIDKAWNYGAEKSYISRNIKFGIPHLGMPSYEGVLSNGQINDLVAYILEMEEKSGMEAPNLPAELETIEYKIKSEEYAIGLDNPWSIVFIDEKRALVAEKPGNLRIIEDGELLHTPVKGTPKVLYAGQGGLMDVAIDPDYAENGWVYLSFSHEIDKRPGERRTAAMTKLVRGKIENHKWAHEEVIFEAPHETYKTSRHHYGCRIVFDKAKRLYFSIGERGYQDDAQDISIPNGKVHRINRDGSIPKDNPFVGKNGAMPSIFSYGNRNIQGMAVHPETGEVWSTEHGPMGGDELNLIKAGKNYGWPVITYGRNYNGTVITEERRREGMEQPNFYWNPSPAFCGLDFYHGGLFTKWNNKLLVGALKYEEVKLLTLAGDRVIHEEILIKGAGRVRDVECGPDGAVYVVLNDPGTILRLTPEAVK